MRIHIFGASGTGTTTLGLELANALECRHFDTDDYFWIPTEPPFETIRDVEARQSLLRQDLEANEAWVLSGSLTGWGNFAIPMFELVVFLQVPNEIRMERLDKREKRRFGEEIYSPDHPQYLKHSAFLEWAKAYDTGGMDMRSLASHEAWTESLPFPVLRLEGSPTVDDSLEIVMNRIARN